MQAPRQAPQAPLTDDQRAANYREARAFYEGIQWTQKARRGERRLTLNYAQALIIKTASYVLSDAVTFNVLPDPGGQLEQVLNSTLAAIGAATSDLQMVIEASVIGDACTKVTWQPHAPLPTLTQVDPATMTAVLDPTDPQRAIALHQTYILRAEAVPVALGFDPGNLISDRNYTLQERWSQETFELWLEGELIRAIPNPYQFVPYAFLHNSRNPRQYWGTSDLDAIYEVCRELNTRMSALSAILDLSGAPVTVLEGVDESEGVNVFPGARWELPEGSRAYLLDLLTGGGITLHIDAINTLYRALHDLAETPRTAFGDTGRPLSGAALEVEIQPLVQRVRRKRQDLESYYVTRNAMLLELLARYGNTAISASRITQPIWPPILPNDDTSDANMAVALSNADIISKHTAAERVGIADPEEEAHQIASEKERAASQTASNQLPPD